MERGAEFHLQTLKTFPTLNEEVTDSAGSSSVPKLPLLGRYNAGTGLRQTTIHESVNVSLKVTSPQPQPSQQFLPSFTPPQTTSTYGTCLPAKGQYLVKVPRNDSRPDHALRFLPK